MIQTMASEQLVARFPALTNTSRNEATTSAKFTPIETMPIIKALEKEGFKTYSAKFDGGKTGRHMVSMINLESQALDGTYETSIIMNSSSADKSLQCAYGNLRSACYNSLFFGTVEDSFKVIHKGKTDFDVANIVEYMLSERRNKLSLAKEMQAIDVAGAKDKLALVMKKLRPAYEFTAINRLMRPRRQADNNNSLFTLYNIAQEGLIRGGVTQANFRRSRPVRSTTEQARLNRGIWQAATEIFAGKTPLILENKQAA